VSHSSRQGTRLHFLVISFCALRAHSNFKNTTWTPRRWIFKKYHAGTFQNMNPFESLYTARSHITSSWTEAVHKANANFLSTYTRLWYNRRSPRHCNHPILLLWASSRPTSFAIYSVVPRSRSMLRRRDGRQPLLNNGKSTYAYCKKQWITIYSRDVLQANCCKWSPKHKGYYTYRRIYGERTFRYREQATGWMGRGLKPITGKIFPLNRQNRFWGPHSALTDPVPGFFFADKAAGAWIWPFTST